MVNSTVTVQTGVALSDLQNVILRVTRVYVHINQTKMWKIHETQPNVSLPF